MLYAQFKRYISVKCEVNKPITSIFKPLTDNWANYRCTKTSNLNFHNHNHNHNQNQNQNSFSDIKDTLPKSPTDIKGVAAEMYRFVGRKDIQKGSQKVISGGYVSLTFFPHTHMISGARKSNVAYMFTNFGTSPFNSASLTKDFKDYKGRYRNSLFFNVHHDPLRTAVTRRKFRKIVKHMLYDIIRESPKDINTLKGVYCFRFFKYPTTQDDQEKLRSQLRKAIKKIEPSSSSAPTPAETEKYYKQIKYPLGDSGVYRNSVKFPFMMKSSRKRRANYKS